MKRHKKAVLPQSTRQRTATKPTPASHPSFRHRDRGIQQGRVQAH
ncbi:MAG: hypothetical protein ACO36E_14500 [Synechocystis sp.]